MPLPRPVFFVGVFTETKIMSHLAMAPSTSVVKKRLFPAARPLTTSSRLGLADGELVAVPRVDAGLREVHHRDGDVRALLRDHRHRGAADVAGADAADCRVESAEGEVRQRSRKETAWEVRHAPIGGRGWFRGPNGPRMTRNAKARDVLEVILTIVLRCEPTERDARLGKGERGGFEGVSGGPSARRGHLRAFDFRTIAAWRFDGSLDRDGATARRGPRNVGESAARDPRRPIRPGKSKRGHGEGCALT